mgnify:CR=1 FL=1
MGTISTVGIIGSGIMGSGLAEVAARAGFDVVVVETVGTGQSETEIVDLTRMKDDAFDKAGVEINLLQGLAIDIAVHVGTLGAVVLFFWPDVRLALQGTGQFLRGRTDTAAARKRAHHLRHDLGDDVGGEPVTQLAVPHEAVVAAGEKESGPTVHIVDDKYDHGRILSAAR